MPPQNTAARAITQLKATTFEGNTPLELLWLWIAGGARRARRVVTITGSDTATAYGAPAMAVPGPVTSAASHGPHALIRVDATPVTGADAILARIHGPHARRR
jgi:predicted Rossmann fold nucleotide-binding protein DprA/Smf involved in DNA uptake